MPWVKIKAPGIGPQVSVQVSICQGKPFWAPFCLAHSQICRAPAIWDSQKPSKICGRDIHIYIYGMVTFFLAHREKVHVSICPVSVHLGVTRFFGPVPYIYRGFFRTWAQRLSLELALISSSSSRRRAASRGKNARVVGVVWGEIFFCSVGTKKPEDGVTAVSCSFTKTHLLSGWPKTSPNFIFATKMVFTEA